jgi:hypothetical protein
MVTPFLLLSPPISRGNGVFALMTASLSGIEVMEFPSLRQARNRYWMLAATLHMGADGQLDFVIIDGESDFASLRKRFEEEHRRRVQVQSPEASLASLSNHETSLALE